MNQNNRGQCLFLLSLICGRIAHSQRSPLSTINSLIHDLHQGVSLAEGDWQDGFAAIAQMREDLESIASFAATSTPNLQPVELSSLLSEYFGELGEIEGVPLTYQNSESEIMARIDAGLFVRMVRALLTYLARYTVQQEGAALARLNLVVAPHAESVAISFLCSPVGVASERVQKAANLEELLQHEFGLGALPLCFGLAVADAFSGVLFWELREEDAYGMRLILPYA